MLYCCYRVGGARSVFTVATEITTELERRGERGGGGPMSGGEDAAAAHRTPAPDSSG